MLSKDDAAKLALNGYSKTDIEALGFSFEVSNKEDTNNSDQHENESDKSDNTENNASVDVSNKSDTTNAAIEALTKTVGELSATVKAMQEANVKGARGNSSKDNNAQSASDVVKNFIKSM